MKASPKALVAHDDSEWRTLFADILKAYDGEVHTASHGLEALEFARNNTYGIVVVDAQLSQMSAMELLLNLRDMDRPMPLVIVSGFNTEAHAHIWSKLGVFFAGPPSRAARQIQNAVGTKRNRRQKEANT